MPDEPEFMAGNRPVDQRINVRREIQLIRNNPTSKLLSRLPRAPHSGLVVDEIARFEEAYHFYTLSYSRLLPGIALELRWSKGPYWAWKNRRRFTKAEKRVADAHRLVAEYVPFDFWTYLLNARILCDRIAGLSRYFLVGNPLPSFTSFADHRSFFERGLSPGPRFAEYGANLLSRTPWFDMPLKEVRDKYLVHPGPRHMRFFGHSTDHDLELILVRPAGSDPNRPFERVTNITVSARRLALDIHS